jgi:hypothetical protein
MLLIIAMLGVFAAILIWKEHHMSAALDRLTASVDAAVARINSTTDDAELNALADKLDAATGGTAPATGEQPLDLTTEQPA